MKPNERQWKQLGFDKDPQPTGIPWALLFQIVQTILAILTYLAKRDPSEIGKAELARIRMNTETALAYWNPAKGDKE